MQRTIEFEKIVKANMKRAYFTALGLLGSHDDAMDASQQAFIKAYNHFDKFDASKNFFTWYYKILKNVCLNMIRNKKNKKEDSIFEERFINSSAENEFEILEEKENIKLIEKTIYQLPEDEREILILREFNGMSYKEISEMLNIPSGTVMSKLFYARKKLSIKLKKTML